MPLTAVTTSDEDVEFLTNEDVEKNVGEEVNGVDEAAADEVVEEVKENIKMGLTSQMSPVTLNMQSGTQFRTRQEKLWQRTR